MAMEDVIPAFQRDYFNKPNLYPKFTARWTAENTVQIQAAQTQAKMPDYMLGMFKLPR